MKRVIAISTAALGCIVLVGCGSQPSPKDVAQSFVSNVQNGDWTKIPPLEQNPNSGTSQPTGVAADILKKDKFQVGDESVNGNSATVDVKVTSPDMSQMVSSMLGDALANAFSGGNSTDSNAQMDQDMEKQLNSSSLQMDTTDVQLNMVKTSDGWKVASNNTQFMSAIVGGLDKLANAFSSSSNN
ncbi:hypothetical protein NZD89_10715 [Alicyclobacillus fastidiosus]|uniref:Lipoprotein n=1 Tax=Alicyclobacillus fastidiosus TaxID=392011 RepID=A0ABY6ZLV3_9BACL|nr:hypothetical protein [Alicyclobacillus fastidiosus]WAH43810.1 hypothetical protein NZD89_10715 [Alicyclobacillus fastidiosus]